MKVLVVSSICSSLLLLIHPSEGFMGRQSHHANRASIAFQLGAEAESAPSLDAILVGFPL